MGPCKYGLDMAGLEIFLDDGRSSHKGCLSLIMVRRLEHPPEFSGRASLPYSTYIQSLTHGLLAHHDEYAHTPI